MHITDILPTIYSAAGGKSSDLDVILMESINGMSLVNNISLE